MRIVGIFSFNNGKEAVTQRHRAELDELLQVIEAVDAEQYKMKSRKGDATHHKIHYSPLALKEALNKQCVSRDWMKHDVEVEFSKRFYVPEYTQRDSQRESAKSLRDMQLTKNKLGLEISFDVDFSMVESVCAKMTIFAKMGVIDCGIEIVPVKAFAKEMSTGVSYFEQFVWDLEHRGVSDIDIPVLILGIDTDGVKPEDLKIAETRQTYVF